MILSLALWAAQAAPPPPVDPEIVVMAERLKTWRGTVKFRKSGPTCKTRQSTGDKGIDTAACAAMVTCSRLAMPDAQTGAAKGQAARDAALSRMSEIVNTCMAREGEAVIAMLHEQRVASRSARTGRR